MLRAEIAAAVVVAVVVQSLPTEGNDVSLQLVGVGTGVICGLAAGALLRTRRLASGEVCTVGGVGYRLVFAVPAAACQLLAYGAGHWFGEGLARFSAEYGISGPDTYANAFVFMALAMVLSRTSVLLAKARAVHPDPVTTQRPTFPESGV